MFKKDKLKVKVKEKNYIVEIIVLAFLFILIFSASTLQVKDIVSIWNQNDEFGTWQGGAWLLGLDWSEVSSTNAYYGHGYGFILAIFIKIFGHNSVLMTQAAIYFQAFMHTCGMLIAWYCIKKLFPDIPSVTRLIAASTCILTIPDLYYIYMFFAETILRFIVWCMFGIIVSYYCDYKRWYKIVIIDLLAIYAFSIHQRCILLIAIAVMLSVYEIILELKKEFKLGYVIKISITIFIIVLFFYVEYSIGQEAYISTMYSAKIDGVGGNLLSERGYTIKSILKDIIFNKKTQQIALQNLLGMIYYISAFECGFVIYGFIVCFRKVMEYKSSNKKYSIIPYIYISMASIGGVLLCTYQYANEEVYNRVELMHYGRYCSYLLAPMVMLGIIGLLTNTNLKIKKDTIRVSVLFIVAGISTFGVLKEHNVTNLFAFANACPGILSVYYEENPYSATLYHTLVGVLWILVPACLIIVSNRNEKWGNNIRIGVFLIVSIIWIGNANEEWKYTHDIQNKYVTQTYDLQNILSDTDEFIAFKSYSYGSGLLQYNNIYSKVHVISDLSELEKKHTNLLVVSQKGIDEMNYIKENYDVEYENERYFVWRYITE